MPIREVRCHDLLAALHTPFVTALRRTTTLESLLVEVVDGDGAYGLGEAPQVWRVTGESLASARACVEGPLTDVLVGRDPDDLVPLLHDVADAVVGNPGARAAVDVAVHDLVARRRGVSLAGLLGGRPGPVPTGVTVAADEPEAVVAAARARVGDGFDVLKLKVGRHADADVATVRAVREAVGVDVSLRLDANQGWTPRDAVRVLTALEDAGADVELVEQPVAARDLAGLRFVRDRVGTPVMADESVFGIRDLVQAIRAEACDLVNVKLAKAGGLLPARTLLELARAHGLGTMVGSMLEGPVGVGAAAALAVVHGTSVVPDLDGAWWLAEAPASGGPSYDGGLLRLPDVPGLGVARS